MSPLFNRRRFLGTSLAAVAATAPWAPTRLTPEKSAAREYYELRTYRLPTAQKRARLLEYLSGALLPALNRLGLTKIGVFTSLNTPNDFDVRVLIPYPTPESFSSLTSRLEGDATYQRAAADHFASSMKEAPYTRISSQFMRAFSSIPTIELPEQTASKQPRIFELRTYESHNEDAARRKVEMFDEGETQLMRDVQLGPVLFGQMLVGDNMPNLTYLLCAEDLDAHTEHWETFLSHPKWNEMKVLPRYTDTVSKITQWFLQPADCSQI
jgi:hypothetical protein